MYFNNIGRLLGTIDSQTRHDDDLGITRTRDAVTGRDWTTRLTHEPVIIS